MKIILDGEKELQEIQLALLKMQMGVELFFTIQQNKIKKIIIQGELN